MDWWKRHYWFFLRALALLCSPMWSGGVQGTISTTCPCSAFRNPLPWLPWGTQECVSSAATERLWSERERIRKALRPSLCLKWKNKICLWSLLVHRSPLQLSLSPLALYGMRQIQTIFGSSSLSTDTENYFYLLL